MEVCINTNSPGCILLLCHFSQVSLRWWEHLQLPAQPPELNSELTLCCRPPDLGSARVARLPREPLSPGGPQLEGHGEGSLLHLQSSMCSDLMVLGTFCVLLHCRWSDFLSPKLWMTWRCSIWPQYRLWLWVLCFWPYPALSRTPLCFLVRKVTTVYSRLDVFLAARHAPHPRSHEGSRARHQNALYVWRFEQKFPVCADSRKRNRYKELWVLTVWTAMMAVALSKIYPRQGCRWCCPTRQRLCCWEHQFWELVRQRTTTAYRWEWNTWVKVRSKVIQMAVIYKLPIGGVRSVCVLICVKCPPPPKKKFNSLSCQWTPPK